MRFLLGLLMLVISGSALATIDVMQFKDEAQEQQFRQLTEQLRCPKCQNNSIADSNSMIATDLRQKVYELMQEGKSQKEIVDYMVARYGNFVTYDPPLTPLTVLLWVMPVRLSLELVAAVHFLRRGDLDQTRGIFAALWAVATQHTTIVEGRRTAQALRTRSDTDVRARMYRGSVVWDYFVRGRRTVDALAGRD